jgi:predicted enzyme related to lactoylglutathione lyase
LVNDIKLLVYPVGDVEKAKVFFGKFLGVEPYVDSPFYVGFKVGDLEVGLDPNSTVGPIAYIDVVDIKSSLQTLTQAGGVTVQDITDVGSGLLIAKIKDQNGSVVGLRQTK